MRNNYELPMIMSAKDLQSMGFSRSMAYRLLQGDLIPVVCIGKRRFIRHDTLLNRLTEQEQTSQSESPTDLKNEETAAPDDGNPENDQLTFEGYGGDEI